jgi:hypothetical protein
MTAGIAVLPIYDEGQELLSEIRERLQDGEGEVIEIEGRIPTRVPRTGKSHAFYFRSA